MFHNIRNCAITSKETWIISRARLQIFQQYLREAAKDSETFATSWLASTPESASANLHIQDSLVLKMSVHDHQSPTILMGPPKHSAQSQNSIQSLGRAFSNSTSTFMTEYIRIPSESPFERCSPRYHLSDSPDYYHLDKQPAFIALTFSYSIEQSIQDAYYTNFQEYLRWR
jgi:hypothetical protein